MGTTGQAMIPTSNLLNNRRLNGGSSMLLDHHQHSKATTTRHWAQSLTLSAGTLTNIKLPNVPKCALLPTSRKIFDGLNEYVIGQRNIKIMLSIGVHNYYKHILVKKLQDAVMQVEPLQHKQDTRQMHMQMQQHHTTMIHREGHLGFNRDDNGVNRGRYDKGSALFWEPTITDLRMDQFRWSTTPPVCAPL
jgi:hypothetical protein